MSNVPTPTNKEFATVAAVATDRAPQARPVVGQDAASRRHRAIEVGLNYLAALGMLAVAYGLYSSVPYLVSAYSGQTRQLLLVVLAAYVVLLPIYYLSLPVGHPTKCRTAWSALRQLWRRWPTESERVALLTLVVKIYFMPMVLSVLLGHANAIWQFGSDLWSRPGSLYATYFLLFHAMLVVDAGCYCLGYAIEHPRLNNEIRSVEPTILGWLVTLACYAPFSSSTTWLLGWFPTDYPEFPVFSLQIVAGVAMLSLTAIFAWASLALGLRASNLTSRGIVTHGPFRWIRHPAYTTKLAAWYISVLPLLFALAMEGATTVLHVLVGMGGWTLLYYLRAITEERHLRRDPAYVEYCKTVRYRFIPKVF